MKGVRGARNAGLGIGDDGALFEHFGVFRREKVLGDHPVEHVVARALSAIAIAKRRVEVGRLDEAAEHGRLLQIDLTDMLAKIALGRCVHSVETVPEKDPVEIVLKDLFLGEILLDTVGEEGLGQLATVGVIEQAEALAPQLLGDGAGPLGATAGLEVEEDSADHADPVDPLVFEKAGVLHRDEGLDEILGHLVDGDRVPVLHAEILSHLLAVAVVEQAGGFQLANLGQIEDLGLLVEGAEDEGEEQTSDDQAD